MGLIEDLRYLFYGGNFLDVLPNRHFRNEKGTGAEFVWQLFLGSLRGTRWSAIGQFFSLSLVTVPQIFANVNLTQRHSKIPDKRRGSCHGRFLELF